MKNILEEVWREEFESTYKTKDNEIGWVYYLQARKKSQEEIDSIRTHLLAQCKISNETFAEKEQLEQELQKTREYNDRLLDMIQAKNIEESFLKSESIILREQLEKAEKVISELIEAMPHYGDCSLIDDKDADCDCWKESDVKFARQYFKDKQGE